jgi:hypothetical protein
MSKRKGYTCEASIRGWGPTGYVKPVFGNTSPGTHRRPLAVWQAIADGAGFGWDYCHRQFIRQLLSTKNGRQWLETFDDSPRREVRTGTP